MVVHHKRAEKIKIKLPSWGGWAQSGNAAKAPPVDQYWSNSEKVGRGSCLSWFYLFFIPPHPRGSTSLRSTGWESYSITHLGLILLHAEQKLLQFLQQKEEQTVEVTPSPTCAMNYSNSNYAGCELYECSIIILWRSRNYSSLTKKTEEKTLKGWSGLQVITAPLAGRRFVCGSRGSSKDVSGGTNNNSWF